MENPSSVRAKKSLGQHFLNHESIAKNIVDAGSVTEGDVVLEIGPGMGMLTKILLGRGATVIAVEKDTESIEYLHTYFAEAISSKKLHVVAKDVREVEPENLGIEGSYKVIANIPYYITGELFRQTLGYKNQPESVVFLVQKEVAERIAREKKESLLSLSIKVFGDPTYVQTVKAGSFTPPPKVDSAIISITNISRDRLNGVSEEVFFEILHTAFGEKRKQVGSTLKKLVGEEGVSKLAIDPSRRPETISYKEWVDIAQTLTPFMHTT